jgi:hypothetical protein
VDHPVSLAASRFRNAIVRCPRDDLRSLRDFPRGSCGDASVLLGEYLHQTGHGQWDYVAGEREPDLHSHAWLEQDGLIVDITADQFDDVDEPVIVTSDRSWHQQFSSQEPRHPALIDRYDPRTRTILREFYERVTAATAKGSDSLGTDDHEEP